MWSRNLLGNKILSRKDLGSLLQFLRFCYVSQPFCTEQLKKTRNITKVWWTERCLKRNSSGSKFFVVWSTLIMNFSHCGHDVEEGLRRPKSRCKNSWIFFNLQNTWRLFPPSRKEWEWLEHFDKRQRKYLLKRTEPSITTRFRASIKQNQSNRSDTCKDQITASSFAEQRWIKIH